MQFVNLLKRRFLAIPKSLKNVKLSCRSKFGRLLSCGSCFKLKHQPYSDEFLAYGLMDVEPGPSNANLNKSMDISCQEYYYVEDRSDCSGLSSSISRIGKTHNSTTYSIDVSSLTDENIAVKGLAQDLRGLRIESNVPFHNLIKNDPLSVSMPSFEIFSDNDDFDFNDTLGEDKSCYLMSAISPKSIRVVDNLSKNEIIVDENLDEMSEGEIQCPPSYLVDSLDELSGSPSTALSDSSVELIRPSSVALSESRDEFILSPPVALSNTLDKFTRPPDASGSLDEISSLQEYDVEEKKENLHCGNFNVGEEEILATVHYCF